MTEFTHLVSRHRFSVMTGLGLGAMSRQARAQSAGQRALCVQKTCNSALCCALFGVIVHGHCS